MMIGKISNNSKFYNNPRITNKLNFGSKASVQTKLFKVLEDYAEAKGLSIINRKKNNFNILHQIEIEDSFIQTSLGHEFPLKQAGVSKAQAAFALINDMIGNKIIFNKGQVNEFIIGFPESHLKLKQMLASSSSKLSQLCKKFHLNLKTKPLASGCDHIQSKIEGIAIIKDDLLIDPKVIGKSFDEAGRKLLELIQGRKFVRFSDFSKIEQFPAEKL